VQFAFVFIFYPGERSRKNVGELAKPCVSKKLEGLIFGWEMLLTANLIEGHMERRQKKREERKAAASKDRRKATLGLQEVLESLF